MLLGVMCVPIALALASQSLASTEEPPRLPHDTVDVRLSGSAEPSDSPGTESPSPAPSPSGASEPRDAGTSGPDQTAESAEASPVPVPEAPAQPGVSVPNVGEIPQQVYQNPQPVPVPGGDDTGDEWDGDFDD